MKLPRFLRGETTRMRVLISMMAFLVLAYFVLPRLTKPVERKSQGSDSLSTSGLGHSLLAATLKAAGYSVDQLRLSPRRDLKLDALVILAEPRTLNPVEARLTLDEIRGFDPNLMLVLPKRELGEAPDGRIYSLDLYPQATVERFANIFLQGESNYRSWHRDVPETLHILRINDSSAADWSRLQPSIKAPVIADLQLIDRQSTTMTPLIECREGILAGEIFVQGLRVLVLSDPDLIANHGYGAHPENAALAHELLSRIAEGTSDIYFDEIIHGHAITGDFWDRLFEFPLSVVVVHGLLVILILIWIGTARFGAVRQVPQPLKAGQDVLVDHITLVILESKNRGFLLQRYVNDSIREVAHHLHLEAKLVEQMEQKLQLRSQAKSVVFDPQTWRRSGKKSRAQMLVIAKQVHHWKKEMMHGTAVDPRTRRSRS